MAGEMEFHFPSACNQVMAVYFFERNKFKLFVAACAQTTSNYFCTQNDVNFHNNKIKPLASGIAELALATSLLQ